MYIYGNHDPEEKCDNRVSLFSVSASDSYTFSDDKNTYRIQHGHMILKGKNSRIIEMYRKLLDLSDKYFFRSVFYWPIHFLEYLGYKFFCESLMTASKYAKRSNYTMKQTGNNSEYLICGDTHCAELDEIMSFANSGSILHGKATYLTIEDGEILLHREKY